MKVYGQINLLKRMMPDYSESMKVVKFSLLMLAASCFFFALANPQVGSKLEKGTRKGVDIMICMDVSNSMLAQDIQPNRLDASKMAMLRFIDKLQGDRIGLVVFAGKAFTQLPITSDYAAGKMFITNVSPRLINEQGTDVAAALDMAAASLLPEDNGNAEAKQLKDLTSKVIIVVSDGEDHFGSAIEMATEIHKLGMTIHTIGIGSTRGEPIPIQGRNGIWDYKKDQEGNTVMTRLNESFLQEIASAGGGIYVHANNANIGFDSILDEINKMYKSDIQEITYSHYESKYQIPLFLGLFFILLEALLFTIKPRWVLWLRNQQNRLSAKTMLIFMLAFASISLLQAQTTEELQAVRNGNKNYKTAESLRSKAIDLLSKGGEINNMNAKQLFQQASEKYQNAEVQYLKGMEKTANYEDANYNYGNALYRQEKYEDAAAAYQKVATHQESSKSLKAKAYHNMGNSYLKAEKYKESIDAYKESLKMNPKDMDTKYNLEYAKKKLIQQQNQQNQNQQQQQQPEQHKKEEQHKQQQAEQRQKEQMNKRQLDALQQNERQTQEKLQKAEPKAGNKQHQEKDW